MNNIFIVTRKPLALPGLFVEKRQAASLPSSRITQTFQIMMIQKLIDIHNRFSMFDAVNQNAVPFVFGIEQGEFCNS